MDFIKKNYEKVILSLVLLGVVGALIALPFVIQADKNDMSAMTDTVVKHNVKPLDPLDLTPQNNLLNRLQNPYELDFENTNKLFNPLTWKKNADGDLIKITTGHEIDAEAAEVTKITPLYLILSLESVETNVEVRYVIGIERQFIASRSQRHQTTVASVGEKKPLFTITQAKGDPAAPDELLLKLADSGETVSISKGKPYQRADAFTADLKFDPEKKTYPNRSVGAQLTLGEETYNIVAIHQNEVILLDQSNQKKTILHYPR
jgi:hypothetical protein